VQVLQHIDPSVVAALQQLCAAYWYCADETSDGVGELFCEDGVLTLGSLVLTGRAAIEEFFREREASMRATGRTTRHLGCNFQAIAVRNRCATLRSVAIVHSGTGELPLPAAFGALASIGAVARLAIVSRRTGERHAWRIGCEAGIVSPVEPAALAAGTTVEIEDLYFNTPARRKFLKSEATEYARCDEAFARIALSRPAVAFSLAHNGRRTAHLPPGAGTVGSRIDVRHLAATPVGMRARIRATLREVDGRRLVFDIAGEDETERIVEGTHERFQIDQARFLARIAAKTRPT